MKKYTKSLSVLLAGLIVATPMINVGAIAVKNIKLKDIVEEVIDDEEPDDKETGKDSDDKDNESNYKSDKEYMDAALKSIEWYRFSLDSDKDKNIVTHLKSKLIENGFSKISVKLVEVETRIGDKEYINKDGDISYHYEDPETSNNLNRVIQVGVKFELSKGNEKRDYSKNISIGWDKPRVRKMLEEVVFPMINEDLLKGENKNLSNIEKDLLLPTKPTKYTSIQWESSNRLALDIKDQGFIMVDGKMVEAPFLGKIKREAQDQKLQLIAHVKFNHGDNPNETIHDKVMNITINGFDLPATKADMQKQLDEKYTVEKLKDSVTRKPAKLNEVTNDIALPTPKETGVDKYFDYKFGAKSNNKNIKIIGYRADILRPLPGQAPYESTITVSMEHRKNGVIVEKDFDIKVMPLTQEELDDEISLMDLAKANYFNGIRADNESKDKITENLKKFTEVSLNNGELEFVYDVRNQKDKGIYPDEIDSKDYQEEWKYFRSSNKRVVEHESLYVKQPKYNTKVRIDSVLSSKIYKKYALAYPENKELQKLYKQPVSAEITVIGSEGIENPEDINKELSMKYSIVYFDKFGKWHYDSETKDIKIKPSESGEVTPYDLLKNSGVKYEGSSQWINSINNIKGPEPDPINNIAGGGWKYSVNDVEPDKTIADFVLKDGDNILFYCTYDYKKNRMPLWKDIDKTLAESKYEIEILNEASNYKVGEEVLLIGKVLEDGQEVEKDIIWKISNEDLAGIEGNKLSLKKSGNLIITAILKEDNKIKTEKNIKITEAKKKDVNEILESMEKHYDKKENFTFREAAGYNHASLDINEDLAIINSKFRPVENETIADVAGNIIGIVAAGANPYAYNGKDYVRILQDSQKSNGKFIMGNRDDYLSVQAYALIALDMAKANYNKESALDMILANQQVNGSFDSENIDVDGMVLAALSNHRDNNKVKTTIGKSIEYVNNNWVGKNQWSLATAIQGLVANGEDLNTSKWTKNNQTIVDEFLNFYTTEKLFDSKTANEQAFMALSDLVKGKSVFKELRISDSEVKDLEIKPIERKVYEKDFIYLDIIARNKDGKIIINPKLKISSASDKIKVAENGKIYFDEKGTYKIFVEEEKSGFKTSIDIDVVERLIDYTVQGPKEDELVEKNREYLIKANIKNKQVSQKTKVNFVVGVYEKSTGRLVNYSIVEKEIEAGKEIELMTGIKTSENGNFFIKTFIWDEDNMRGLAG